MPRIELPKEYYDQEDGDNTCFLCNKPNYTKKFHITHYDFPFTFKTCQCGIEKQIPMPNEKFFNWFFNSDVFYSSKNTKKERVWGFYDYFKDESSRMATSKRRYQVLKKYFSTARTLNIMKIGPSTGTFLYVANNHGHNAIGCDISKEFTDYAMKNYNVRIDNGRFEHMNYEQNQFDIIMLFNVIENIPNQDEFYKEVSRTLKKGGYFIFNFVNMKNNIIAKVQGSKYFIYRPPICYSFTLDNINRIMTKYEFKIVDNKPDIRFMHAEKIFTLLHWKWLLPIIKTLKIDKINFPIYAYPSRIIVAQKQ